MLTPKQIEEKNKARERLAKEIPPAVNNLMAKYQEDAGKLNNVKFLSYPSSEAEKAKALSSHMTVVQPTSYDNIHFSYQIALPAFMHTKPIDIDSFYGTMESYSNVIIALPTIPDNSPPAIRSRDGNLHFQSSDKECWLIAGKIARLLAYYVPPDLLQECAKSGLNNNLAQKFGYDKMLGAIVLDFKKLHEKMPEILPQILSFCQNTKYREEFCCRQGIDYELLKASDFVKVANQQNQQKSHNLTSLEKLLQKYQVNNQNRRPQHHADKVLNRTAGHEKY